MFRIKGYEPGANITVLNTIYHKSRKDPETGKYGKDSIDIIFKDLDTGQKKIEHIVEPTYTYYIANDLHLKITFIQSYVNIEIF
jgi:hypothetical protein